MTRVRGTLVAVIVLAMSGTHIVTCAEGPVNELECEEAAARLSRCCPGFDPKTIWCHDNSGNHSCNPIKLPALDEEESRCIRATSCEALRARDVCGRAARARPHEDPDLADDGGVRAPVCP